MYRSCGTLCAYKEALVHSVRARSCAPITFLRITNVTIHPILKYFVVTNFNEEKWKRMYKINLKILNQLFGFAWTLN